MLLALKRHWFTDKSTSGVLLVNGTTQCFTLEDVARPQGVKIPGKTCILAGEYRITIDDSTRFKRPMPHILMVPLFEGIRIHAGNTSENTEGCVLVGAERIPDTIMRSREAFDALFSRFYASLNRGIHFDAACARCVERERN